jgi:hypothetical protein
MLFEEKNVNRRLVSRDSKRDGDDGRDYAINSVTFKRC